MQSINTIGNFSMIEKLSYVCATTEFKQETDKEDGCLLYVIDEAKHEHVGTYIAYHGYWNKKQTV